MNRTLRRATLLLLAPLAGCCYVPAARHPRTSLPAPVKKGWELRRAMGKPETLLFPTGHYSTLIFIPYIRSQCLMFFRERFAEPR